MSNINDYVIEDGVLIKYNGDDKEIVIPDGVTSIRKYTFSSCDTLESVEMPESVTTIDDAVFSCCKNLRSVRMSKGITSIGKDAFCWCENLESIEIPEGVTDIGNGAFHGCKQLKSIHIPSTVINMGSNLFEYCDKLTNITLADGIIKICDGSFRSCEHITNIIIPQSVKEIGDSAFSCCIKLKKVVIPHGVTSIGDHAFYCAGLNSINIPDSVVEIGYSCFSYCSDLKCVTLPKSIERIRFGTFEKCRKLSKVIIPDGVVEIENSAFSGCEKMDSIALPDSLIKIGQNTFYKCNHMIDENGYLKKALKNKIKVSSDLIVLYDGTPEDTARILLYCSGKGWTDAVNSKFNQADVDIVLTTITEELKPEKKIKKDAVTRVIDYMINTLPYASNESLVALCEVLKQKGADISELESSKRFNEKFLGSQKTESATNENLHPVEAFVNENYEKYGNLRDIEKLVKDGVKYIDSDEKCSKEAVVLLIGGFAEKYVENKYYSLYKTAYATCEFSTVSDKIAEALDKTELTELLGKLAYEHGKAYFLPYGRYASEGQIAELLTWMRKWENWGQYSGKGRKKILDARAGVLLSNTKNAMIHFDKIEKLDDYAKFHNADAETIRDTVLADFGFDEDGKKTYNVGLSVITASLQNDLTIALFDETAEKTVKSIPKKNNDIDKVAEALEDLSDMKKTLKRFIKSRFDKLFTAFLEGIEFDSDKWKTSYLSNAVLRKCAQMLVWQQDDKTFIICDKTAITSEGTAYEINVSPIKLAHPMEMKKDDVKNWQKYFTSRSMKQPFIQIWEPVVDFENVAKDRYKDVKMPIMRFANYSKHGIYAVGYHIYSDDFGVDFKDCKLDITDCDCNCIVFDQMDGQNYTFGEFEIENVSRYSNHIIGILDKWIVADKIQNDDISIINILSSFTLAQITELINIANESGSVNSMAVLLEHKNNYYSDYNPMEVFTLE